MLKRVRGHLQAMLDEAAVPGERTATATTTDAVVYALETTDRLIAEPTVEAYWTSALAALAAGAGPEQWHAAGLAAAAGKGMEP